MDSQPQNLNRATAIIILVVIVSIIIIGGYFLWKNGGKSNTNNNSSIIKIYQDNTYHYSFSLPDAALPIQGNSTTNSTSIINGFAQFTIPSYLSEGVELIPSLQIGVNENKEYFINNPRTNLNLSDYITANEINSFRGEIEKKESVTNGKKQILICEKRVPGNCAFYLLTNDGEYVIRGSLDYPRQGPRSYKKDVTLEEAFQIMRISIQLQ